MKNSAFQQENDSDSLIAVNGVPLSQPINVLNIEAINAETNVGTNAKEFENIQDINGVNNLCTDLTQTEETTFEVELQREDETTYFKKSVKVAGGHPPTR